MENDVRETKNIYTQHLEIVQRLKEALEKLEKEKS